MNKTLRYGIAGGAAIVLLIAVVFIAAMCLRMGSVDIPEHDCAQGDCLEFVRGVINKTEKPFLDKDGYVSLFSAQALLNAVYENVKDLHCLESCNKGDDTISMIMKNPGLCIIYQIPLEGITQSHKTMVP